MLVLVAGPLLLIAGYFALGMPGMDHSSTSGADSGSAMSSMDHASFTRMDSDAFAARTAGPSTFVVNVHTPYDGEIDGTDAFIAYERVLDDVRLPANKDAEILLYCRTGRMSGIAAEELVEAGYTNVSHLEGGMDAWRADGRTVRMRSLNIED